MVGISSRDEAATVSSVVRSADAGLSVVSRTPGSGLIVLADNGSTDGTVEKFLATHTMSEKMLIDTSAMAPSTGKGTNVLALIDKALEICTVERLVLLDADVRSTTATWVPSLANAAESPSPTLVTPTYSRHRYEGNITNHLASPLIRALFGVNIQQPIGGEFALNRSLMEIVRSWPRPESSEYYGIDIWLTASTLLNGYLIREVPLGQKLHDPSFRTILFMPQQVIDSLFRVAVNLPRPRFEPICAVDACVRNSVDEITVMKDTAAASAVAETLSEYLKEYSIDICKTFPFAKEIFDIPNGGMPTVDSQSWPIILADAIQALSQGDINRVRDHLIALYILRIFSYWGEIDMLPANSINKLFDDQAERVAQAVRKRCIEFSAGDRAVSSAPFDRGRWLRCHV
jgi:glycosyltransferase involved in cell wall biosynthesis